MEFRIPDSAGLGETSEDSEMSASGFPQPGDLVWGRMHGFPYWPAFITRSPQGLYRREGKAKKFLYHVQFFNWNDESGWCNSVLEFDGLDQFKKIAGKFSRNKISKKIN